MSSLEGSYDGQYSISPSPSPSSASKVFLDVDVEYQMDFNGVTIGVCAMNKKSYSSPMQNILSRIGYHEHVRVVIFSDDTIVNRPVEEWPTCDALIAFYSKGFPLDKAMQYVELKSPKMVINDLEMQYSLMDRRKVYEILKRNGIDVPPHVVLNRDSTSCPSPDIVQIDEDTLEVNGHTFHKPFVEKPISAEDHNIYIYFPSGFGGGCQRLFRKNLDRSSMYHNVNAVRRDGSYIYEEFMPTDGSDVKVYTVGPDYAHSEARKSPALDGRVDRDGQGKEKRFPVLLTTKEKLIARKVCLAFKQTVCGFDLLRANGNSYVCDVNGFSFVKNSEKYYDDCSQIILESVLSKVAPHFIPETAPTVEHLAPKVPVPILTSHNTLYELRCVISVIRHADRTPKQKMKMIVRHPDFFDLFQELGGYKKGHLKVKKPKELQKVLDIARKLLDDANKEETGVLEEKIRKLHQLKNVLEMYGHFSGINRKVQFKLLHKDIDNSPLPSPALLLILKWGGEVTPAGQHLAEELGKAFRCMYPGGEGEYSSLPGSGFLRLHSTYRHDLKVYASDEGRVQLTAAAFTKGLLDLEGNMASILAHLVKIDQDATYMLDTSSDAAEPLHKVKQLLHHCLQSTKDFDDTAIEMLAPTGSAPLMAAIRASANPHQTCVMIRGHIRSLLLSLEDTAKTTPDLILYHGESLNLMISRWSKLLKDFTLRNGKFDISKVPDIYDCIKYDLQHNRVLDIPSALTLYKTVLNLADIIIPQEYGITVKEKLNISGIICKLLLKKIRADIHHTYDAESDFLHRLDPKKSRGVISPNRCVRTRLYFTSESHIHSLVNILKYGGHLKDRTKSYSQLDECPELNYLSQVAFMVFEDKARPPDSEDRYIVETHFSPGVKSRQKLLKGKIVPENVTIAKLRKSLIAETSSPSQTRVRRRSVVPTPGVSSSYPRLEDIEIISSDEEGVDEEELTSIKSRKISIESQSGYQSLVTVLHPLVHISTMKLKDVDSYLAELSGDI